MLLIHRNRNCHHAAGNLKRTIGPLKIYGAQHSMSRNVGSCLLPHHIIQRGRSLIGHKACHPLLNCNIGFIKQLAAVDIACSNAHLGHLIAKARKQLLALLRSLCLHVFGISIGHKPCQHPAREAYHYAHASLHRGFPPDIDAAWNKPVCIFIVRRNACAPRLNLRNLSTTLRVSSQNVPARSAHQSQRRMRDLRICFKSQEMSAMCELRRRTSPPHFLQAEETWGLAQYVTGQAGHKAGVPPAHSPSAHAPYPSTHYFPVKKAAKTDRNVVHRRNVAGGASRNGAQQRPPSQTALNMNIRVEALCTHAHLGRQG